jgi:hypothetical protein
VRSSLRMMRVEDHGDDGEDGDDDEMMVGEKGGNT